MMMRRATIFCAAALLATGGVATYATTPEGLGEERSFLSITPYVGLNDSKQVLLFLSQAESLIYKGDGTFAKMHINEALSAAARLPSAAKETNARQLHRLTVLTLADGVIERRLLVVQPENITAPLDFPPDILPEGYAVAAAEVHYIKAGWDKEKLLVALNNILRGIEKGKSVTSDFKSVHKLLMDGNEHSVSDRRAAQDHIALARTLIRIKAYKPAKTAMKRANDHLKQVAEQKDASPKRFEDIATMRNEMENVSSTIERNEPGAFKELDRKMEKWWNLLS